MKKITLFISLMIFSLGYSQDLPLDFESSTTTYAFTDFDGGISSKIANPVVSGINTSATVMQVIKGPGAPWTGTKILMPSPIDFTTKGTFKIKVLSPVAGRKLNLKFEGPGTYFEKLSEPIQAANVWEELTFDFTGVSGVSNNSVWIVFMFDLGSQGDGSADSTYLFDDITQVPSLSTTSFETAKIKTYPNPVKDYLTIEAESTIEKVSIYNVLGQEVLVKTPKSNSATLQINTLQKGVYVVKSSINGKLSTSKFVKE